MIITKKFIPRRALLRGIGAALSLPLLDAMIPALSAQETGASKPVKRLGVVYIPNGMAMEYWTPASTGRDFELTPVMQPLAGFRDRILPVSGLKLPWDNAPHAGGSAPFLTGSIGNTGETNIHCNVSMDQIVARQYGQHTQLGSLELAMEDRGNSGQCSNSFACIYTNTIAWRDATTPLPMQNNPRIVFERMFGDSESTDPQVRQQRIESGRSILDSVLGTVNDLKREVGAADQDKINQYLDGIRDAERRLEKAEEQKDKPLPVVDRPSGIPASYEQHAKLMFDLQLLAYQTDLTRVITFMLGREQSSLTYPEIGVAEAHHPLSHHAYDPEKIATMSKINTFHVQLFNYYLERLDATPDINGSLLDNTLLLYGSGISDSHVHKHDNLPILLAGGSNLGIKGGRHLHFENDLPLANLMVTLMDKLGVPEEQLGNSSAALDIG